MRRMLWMVVIGVAAVGLLGCEVGIAGSGLSVNFGRQADELFQWEGRLAGGQLVETKGINGSVEANRSTNGLVEVSAERRGRRSDPDVRIEVVEHAGGVTVCAVYPREGNVCLPGDEGRISARRNDVKVTFTVAVPESVDFTVRTVNGSVKAADLSDDVRVHTVNGSVDGSTDGHVRAKTVNGSIKASMGQADWDGTAALETVNGSVTIWLPDAADVDLQVRTTNGSIKSDLEMSNVDARRRRLDARLGDGGRDLRVKTVNGSVRIRRSN